jgi:hypothetical protein
MRKALLALLSGIMFFAFGAWNKPSATVIGDGEQPQISADTKGVIRVVFGRGESIFCATSDDKGITFSKPVLVAKVPKMHLGMSRGPQVTSSDKLSIITAMDQTGNIHWFRLLSQGANKWESMGTVNDLPKSAPEGLMSIASDKKDNFYAVWLDTRTGGKNQIYFSSLADRAANWSKNLLTYRSPDGHVCECCKPNIAVNGAEVVVMYRNWLNGSRDLYLTRSANNGRSFTSAEKLGLDTWKLNGCPMDGGGLVIGNNHIVQTVWQRKGLIYYDLPGKPEAYIAKGRVAVFQEMTLIIQLLPIKAMIQLD